MHCERVCGERHESEEDLAGPFAKAEIEEKVESVKGSGEGDGLFALRGGLASELKAFECACGAELECEGDRFRFCTDKGRPCHHDQMRGTILDR